VKAGGVFTIICRAVYNYSGKSVARPILPIKSTTNSPIPILFLTSIAISILLDE